MSSTVTLKMENGDVVGGREVFKTKELCRVSAYNTIF